MVMNKWLIVAVVVVIVVGGGYFLMKGSSTTQTPQLQPTQTNPSPSEAMKEEASPSAMQAEGNSVTLTATGYSPASLTVKVGTTVTWTNKSGEAATVNSDPHPTHTDYPPLNLGSFADGATKSLKFDKAGTYGYHNHFNPSERGTIIVQ